MDNTAPHKTLYGRRSGRPLRAHRQDALDTLLPELQIQLDEDQSIDINGLFTGKPDEVWLEIGFGSGEHLIGLMEQNPGFGFIGVEPYINGMAAFLKSARELDYKNLRVLMDDAVPLVKALPENCIHQIYVLNPDPWPKTRHHKRRIINQDNLNEFSRILVSGGRLVMATDVDELAEWMCTQAMIHPAFEWTAECADDWRVMPQDWIKTRYEQKGEKAGRKQSYLIFENRN